MVKQSLYCMALGILVSASSYAFARDCNPEKITCGTDPYTFQCPPCPPGGVHFADPNSGALSGAAAEHYRRSLESYLDGLEAARERDPNASLVGYREGVQRYREGITLYRESVRSRVSRGE
jgi:hypothetical protein